MDNKVTNAFDIELPIKVVELEHLKTRSGDRVKVLCEAVDELEAVKAFGMPGEHAGGVNASTTAIEVVDIMDKIAPSLLHGATALADGDGNPTIRPAFHFDDDHKVPGSIPARYLRLSDKILLITAILNNSGLGGAVPEAQFPAGDGEGLSRGVGTVEDVASNGNAAARVDELVAPE